MAPITAYFRVISILVNSVYKEETLLDSGFQIISMSRATVDTSKITWNLSIVATTCWNGTCSMLTSAKLSVGYLVVKENSTRSPHYIIHYIYTWLLVRTTTISIWPLSSCCYLMSYYSSICVFLKATMLSTCALTSYL